MAINNNTQPSILERVLESRAGRHTFGRIDAIARTAVLAFGSVLQIAKLSGQSLLWAASFGKLCKPERISSTSALFVITLYKTAIAFRDVLVAPHKDVAESILALKTVWSITFKSDNIPVFSKKKADSDQPSDINNPPHASGEPQASVKQVMPKQCVNSKNLPDSSVKKAIAQQPFFEIFDFQKKARDAREQQKNI